MTGTVCLTPLRRALKTCCRFAEFLTSCTTSRGVRIAIRVDAQSNRLLIIMGDVRPGDWTCPSCNANVFASKMECFRCQAPKPAGAGGGRFGGGGGGSYGGFGGARPSDG